MVEFESDGMGGPAGQDLKQDQDKAFLVSLLMVTMLLKSCASFSNELDSFLQSNEMWNPDKWTEFVNSTVKHLQSMGEIDSLGIGALLKDMPSMGADNGAESIANYSEEGDHGLNDGDHNYEAYAAAANYAAEDIGIDSNMKANFIESMGADAYNIISASSHTESVAESYATLPPNDFPDHSMNRGPGIAAAG